MLSGVRTKEVVSQRTLEIIWCVFLLERGIYRKESNIDLASGENTGDFVSVVGGGGIGSLLLYLAGAGLRENKSVFKKRENYSTWKDYRYF